MIVSLSSFQIYPAVNGGYDEDALEVRWWYNRGFLDSSTVFVQGGNGQNGFYITSPCTVDGDGIITVSSTELFSTLDAIDPAPQSIQIFGRLYSNNTPKQWIAAYSSTPQGWVIQNSTPLTYEDLVLENQSIVLANPPLTFPTFAQMIAYIDSLVPTPLASDVVIGRTRLSVAPANALTPIAVADDDPRLGSWINIAASPYFASSTKTAAQNTTAITSANTAAAALGLGLYIPVQTFTTNSVTITVPVQFAPGASLLRPANGQTVTFTKAVTADPSKHFDNALSGQGSIVFQTADVGVPASVTPLCYPQWWGAIADYSTDCAPSITAAISSGCRRIYLPNGGYALASPVVIANLNFIMEGQSRVYTDIFAKTADISTGGGPNAMFINSASVGVAGPNAIFKTLRFISFGVNFTGWVFWTEEGVQGGKDIFSTLFKDLWVALGGAALGFLHGGMSDCTVDSLDIELTNTVFELKGVGVSTNTFTNCHMTSCQGPFISALDTMATTSITGATNANPVVFTTPTAPGSASVPNTPVIISGLTGSMGAKLNGFHVATRLSATTFSVPINTTALSAFGGTVTWKAPSSTQIQISNIAASNQLSYVLLEAKNGIDWQIKEVSVEYNGGGTVAGGLASFDTMSKVLMTNFTARRLSGGMSGIAIKNSQVKLNTGYIFNPQSSSFASAGIDISSTSTTTLPRLVDVDINNVTIENGDASVPQVNISADGSVRIRNSRFNKSAYYAIVATNPSTADITVSNNEILNANYNVASVVPIVAMETSGRFECNNNTIGVDDALAVPLANFSLTGVGTAKINGNTFVGAQAMFGGASTQPVFTTLFDSAALPINGAWQRGSIVTNSLPAEAGGGGSKYIITGWSRVVTGTGNVLNTDWFQMRTLTGN